MYVYGQKYPIWLPYLHRTMDRTVRFGT